MAALGALRRLRRLSSLASLHGRCSCGNQACQGTAVHCTVKDGSKPRWWSRFRRRGDDSQQAPQDPTACPAVLYVPEDLEPPCIPLIVPPDSPQYDDEDEDDSSYVTWDLVLPERPSRLSTITEFTESTYDSSSDWQYRVTMVNPRPLSSSETTSSHDDVLEYSPDSHQDDLYTVDPDRMAILPSSSAAKWLSSYAAAPSHAPAESDFPPKPPNSGATSNNASLRRRSGRRARVERGDSLEI
ncbi:hypothetical protein L210DRAFT_3545969 [Boletus edulis BED1]|uniref:Uncharacterized protein n=1 Tax=Boletus edulis BED1 TaxID=1328754 RepID=A0AAD4BRI1_BOLED|nr:hypothetical protein L210DRAFT_3545969 [Boletus edulis BED1]